MTYTGKYLPKKIPGLNKLVVFKFLISNTLCIFHDCETVMTYI